MKTNNKVRKEEKIIETLNQKIEKLTKQIESLSQNEYSQKFFDKKIKSLTESIQYLKQTVITIMESCFEKMSDKELKNCQVAKEFYQNMEHELEENLENLKFQQNQKIKEFHASEEYQNYHLTNSSKETLIGITELKKYYPKGKMLNVIDACIFLFEEEERKKQIIKNQKDKRIKEELETAYAFYKLYLDNTEEFEAEKFEKYLIDCTPNFYQYATHSLQKDLENNLTLKLESLNLPKIFPEIITRLKKEGFLLSLKEINFVLKQNEDLKKQEEKMKEEFKNAQERIQKEHQEFLESLKNPAKLQTAMTHYLCKKFGAEKIVNLQNTVEERLFLELLQNLKQDRSFLEKIEKFFQLYYEETKNQEKLEEYNRNFHTWKESFKTKTRESGREAEIEIARFHRFEWISTLEREKEGLEIQKTVLENELRKYGPKFFLLFSKKRKREYNEIQKQLKQTEIDLKKNKEELSKKQKYFEQDGHQPYKTKNFIYEKNQNLQNILQFLLFVNEIMIPLPNPQTEMDTSYKKEFENMEQEFASITLPKEYVLLDFMKKMSEKYTNWSNREQESVNEIKKEKEQYANTFTDLLCKTYGCEPEKKIDRYKTGNIKNILNLLANFRILIENNKLESLTPTELNKLNQIYQSEIELPRPSEWTVMEDFEHQFAKKRKIESNL